MNVINTDEGMYELALALRKIRTPLYIDIESTGLNPWTFRMLIISLRFNGETYVIDCTATPEFVLLKDVLENPRVVKVIHNATFEWKAFYHHIGAYTRNIHCSLIAEQELLSGLVFKGFGLDDVVERRLKKTMAKTVRKEFIDAPLSFKPQQHHFEYAAMDVDVLEPIYDQQMEEIKRYGLEQVYTVDMSNIPVASKMEYRGVLFDMARCQLMQPDVERLLDGAHDALQEIFVDAGVCDYILFTDVDGMLAVNPNSQPQMLTLLHRVGVDVVDLNEKTIQEWDARNGGDGGEIDFDALIEDNTVSTALIDYQGITNPYLKARMFITQLDKLLGTYIIGLQQRVNPVTGALHFGFGVCGAASTGRYSSAPNGQNLPQDGKLRRFGLNHSIRSCFIARPGKQLVIADLSSIELVILAVYSNCKALLDILPPYDDPHALVAAELFKVPRASKGEDGEYPLEFGLYRSAAKTMNYAVSYGTTEHNLSRTMSKSLAPIGRKVSVEEAKGFIVRWKQMFPETGKFLDQNARYAMTRRYTESALGRKRFWPASIHERRWMENRAGREGQNHPIQATCADLMKLGLAHADTRLMALCDTVRDDWAAYLLMTVHDEIVAECTEELIPQTSEIIENSLKDAGKQLFPDHYQYVVAKAKHSFVYNK